MAQKKSKIKNFFDYTQLPQPKVSKGPLMSQEKPYVHGDTTWKSKSHQPTDWDFEKERQGWKNIKECHLKMFEEFEVGKASISDRDKYLKNMEASLADKMFWINKVDPDVIVDFGTADGALLDKLRKIKPNVKLVGYDIDQGMLKEASKRLSKDNKVSFDNNPEADIILTNDWNLVSEYVGDFQKPMIFLSSVIHEVYSYTTGKNIKYFWDQQIFGGDFKWVVVRDMMPSETSGRFSNIEDIKRVRDKANPESLAWFEREWGPIDRDYRNLLHFLLKYRYEDNFDREMKENYVPVTLETVKKKIPNNYQITYEDHFILPYIQQQVQKDFGITIKEPTHVKLILEKR